MKCIKCQKAEALSDSNYCTDCEPKGDHTWKSALEIKKPDPKPKPVDTK